MKVFLSAGEASSDIHGAELVKALQKEAALQGQSIEIFGMGGPELRKVGLRLVVDSRGLLAMGFTEILSKIFKFRKALQTLSTEIQRVKPDVLVVIDYPDFHFRLIQRVLSLKIPAFYFIPPKVWVWRTGRVKRLRENFKEVLCIFPFEKKFFESHQVPVTYVGNPLLDELPVKMTREAAREQLSISQNEQVILMMPGSRPAELKRHIPILFEAAKVFAQKNQKKIILCVPLPATADVDAVRIQIDSILKESDRIVLKLTQGASAIMMKAADFGIIKSGTSTLEAAILDCPHVIIYKPSTISAWIVKYFVRYLGPVGLANLILGKKKGSECAVPEILASDVTVNRMVLELERLSSDQEFVSRLKSAFSEVRTLLGVGADTESPSRKAARRILGLN